jgi:hypothetical protein
MIQDSSAGIGVDRLEEVEGEKVMNRSIGMGQRSGERVQREITARASPRTGESKEAMG